MVQKHERRAATVVGVSLDGEHRFTKTPVDVITLQAGLGVVGDAHAGATVQHRSRVAKDPGQPNLRQVHLMHQELFEELRERGFDLHSADLGENITTVGVDLLALPRGTTLRVGDTAQIEVTGLRNPCQQINGLMPGLLKEVLHRNADGSIDRRTGVMGVVITGGDIRPNDPIQVTLPNVPHEPLECV